MNTKQNLSGVRAAVGAILLAGLAQAGLAADRPYTEGQVSIITSIRTVDGKFDDYMAWLAGPWKQFADAQKQAGIIVDYHIYQAFPRGADQPDLYMEVIYKNMAALDNMDVKVDPIAEKLFGNMKEANAAQAERSSIRTVLGDEMIRELKFK
jgi:hypothetical protein